MLKKASITVRIGTYLLIIILLASLITGVSILMIVSHKSDAELINTTGSMRTQAYRLLYDMEYAPKNLNNTMLLHTNTLASETLKDLETQICLPKKIKTTYGKLYLNWQTMQKYMRNNQLEEYRLHLPNYVAEINDFVKMLQNYFEKKNNIICYSILFFMAVIISIVSYFILFLHREIIKPLEKIMLASTQVQIGQFEHVPLDINQNNEIGRLGFVFSQMTTTLQRLYMRLEQNVNDKTNKLTKVNRSLTMLYQCSQIFNSKDISPEILENVLQKVFNNENLTYLKLEIFNTDDWNISLGEQDEKQVLQYTDLSIDDMNLGVLYWQSMVSISDQRTMHNVVQMLARALYFHRIQKQQQYLLILEERSIIARELHDSLAQVLSYLKIQLTLLKKSLAKSAQAEPKTMVIVEDFEQALIEAYTQLRELLSTFRLTIQEANLKTTLEEVVNSLRPRTNILMNVDCRLPSQSLDPQQLIHVLQIIREAILNAIKHSKAKHIDVIAHINDNGEYEILVCDDGVGMGDIVEPIGHYGLNIMHERATRLGATLRIENGETHGTVIKLIFNNKV